MRWQGETEEQRKDRLCKGIVVFAFLPIRMDDGTWVWLESYLATLVRTNVNGNCFWKRSVLDEENQNAWPPTAFPPPQPPRPRR